MENTNTLALVAKSNPAVSMEAVKSKDGKRVTGARLFLHGATVEGHGPGKLASLVKAMAERDGISRNKARANILGSRNEAVDTAADGLMAMAEGNWKGAGLKREFAEEKYNKDGELVGATVKWVRLEVPKVTVKPGAVMDVSKITDADEAARIGAQFAARAAELAAASAKAMLAAAGK